MYYCLNYILITFIIDFGTRHPVAPSPPLRLPHTLVELLPSSSPTTFPSPFPFLPRPHRRCPTHPPSSGSWWVKLLKIPDFCFCYRFENKLSYENPKLRYREVTTLQLLHGLPIRISMLWLFITSFKSVPIFFSLIQFWKWRLNLNGKHLPLNLRGTLRSTGKHLPLLLSPIIYWHLGLSWTS